MPTKPAAIHSMASMKRSMKWRVMLRSNSARDGSLSLLRQSVVFGERRTQFGQRYIRIDPGFADALAPGLDQRFGSLLPQRGLLRVKRIDFLAGLRLYLVDASILELAPRLTDATGCLGAAIVVDRLLLAFRHLAIFVLVHDEDE